ncbi:hypothetical protein KUTeg_009655 [Tegillarca granosa]|uniref:Protein kinase domain-containing protein n=1 Tax=Tegillarca granosa TaxID=220873 RepID=A0ABQ9F8T0_TEGGR|nr:hypothetical protein KUTeg_009655 [Tegillarca granosa]
MLHKMGFSTYIDNDHTVMVSKKSIDEKKCIDKTLVQQSNKINEQNDKNKIIKSVSKKTSVKSHKKDEVKDEKDDFIEDYEHKERYTHVFNTYEETSRFILEGICGVGVSSVVRRCIEKETGQEYAVKIIDISGEKVESYQADLIKRDTIREINILRMCSGHEHIIQLHDSFETPTFIFLVFELCKQGELFDYLTQVVTLSEKRTRLIMRQLFEAVEFIHNKNIPENILLDDNLNVKLSDFGFATVLELCGTPGYLAPEVLAVSMYENVPGYGKEVDMWACGVIMYTLLCGGPPFWHRKQMQMLRMIMQANYKFGSPEWDDVSQAPKDLISSLLVIDPKKRLTASEALSHPFFKRELKPGRKFLPRRTFRAAIFCVRFFHRLRHFYYNPPPISMDVIHENPYSVKTFRKMIDGCAFRMYGHWVKKADNQNRAALFEHMPRDDWKNSLNEDFS